MEKSMGFKYQKTKTNKKHSTTPSIDPFFFSTPDLYLGPWQSECAPGGLLQAGVVGSESLGVFLGVFFW